MYRVYTLTESIHSTNLSCNAPCSEAAEPRRPPDALRSRRPATGGGPSARLCEAAGPSRAPSAGAARLPFARHLAPAQRNRVPALPSLPARAASEPAAGLRARRLPRRALLGAAQPPAPARRERRQGEPRTGHEGDRGPGGARGPARVRPLGPGAPRPLPPADPAHAARGARRAYVLLKRASTGGNATAPRPRRVSIGVFRAGSTAGAVRRRHARR
jgi:hypothetical protein